jgi:putative GTP pyrophosphokinase
MIFDNKTSVDRLGDYFRSLDQYNDLESNQLRTLNEFRRLFHPIMNQVNAQCRSAAKRCRIDKSTIIYAQRIKRLESIILKLNRFENMKLSRMQDIGGVRAVLPTLDAVIKLSDNYLGRSRTLILKNKKDYIKNPKPDGYRGVHLIIEAPNKDESTKTIFPNLCVELQLRTPYQHAWATAVEMIGLVNKRSYKTGDWEDDWKSFFGLVSDIFFWYEHFNCENDKTKTRFSELDFVDLAEKLKHLNAHMHALDQIKHLVKYQQKLAEFQVVFSHFDVKDQYVLLDMDFTNQQIESFLFENQSSALKALTLQEEKYLQKNTGQALLISGMDIKNLQKAYPNYFMDLSIFTGFLEGFLDAHEQLQKPKR